MAPIATTYTAQPHKVHQDPVLARLLANNAQWAADVERAEPGFHEKSAKGQSPKVLWLGCADSRVPESVVLACKPGEVFVHRNIANQVHLNDDNILSVLAYAIAALGVEHVVVVGHTQCGGAAHCLDAASKSREPATTPLGRWLAPLTDLAASLPSASPQLLVEENVRMQVENVLQSEPVLAAWTKGSGQRLKGVHGWVYEVEHGRVRDLGISTYAP